MCTVTYIPTTDGALLTSNRDEHIDRAPAIPPKVYQYGDQQIIYPKDAKAGGTWITLINGKSAAILLNGGFEKHRRQPAYRQSRGLIMLEIVNAIEPIARFNSIELADIEPFTMIVFYEQKLRRCTWDGFQKHVEHLNIKKAHIWSSATLYDRAEQMQREIELQKWVAQNPSPAAEDILAYHLSDDLKYETSKVDRVENMRTVSVTSLVISPAGDGEMHYRDLCVDEEFEVQIAPLCSTENHHFNSFYWKTRRFFIRLLHWEYWPMECVYLPLVPLWLWLSLRARSLLFFSAANPGIENSGFIHERKSNIYPMLPAGFYPKTVLCKTGIPADQIASQIQQSSLSFPLIAKPDIGERGVQVKVLKSNADLEAYRQSSRFDFLVQEYIDYPNEIAVFYYRFPGEVNGRISGIVGKEFLSVTGDGKTSLLALILQNDRAILQLPVLAKMYSEQFKQILLAGETFNLVPYGNHSRGCKFIDLQNYISPELTQVIDNVCKQIDGFYFGRLDIRFKNWEDLRAGQHFSIIELNGTGSEPTHIYDPDHSIFHAWKQIYKHWKIVFRISMMNRKCHDQQFMSWKEGIQLLEKHKQHLRRLNACDPHEIRSWTISA